MRVEAVDLDALIATLDQADSPLDLDALTERLARYILERTAPVRAYAPGAHYALGERVWFEGETAEVVAYRQRGNPVQGKFLVLDLKRHSGSVQRVVAAVPGAPSVALSPGVTPEAVAQAVSAHCEDLRGALLADPRVARAMAGDHVTQEVPQAVTPTAPAVPRCVLFAGPVLRERVEAWPNSSPLPEAQVGSLLTHWRAALQDGEAWGEAQTWRRFVRPVLGLLGWAVAEQAQGHAYDLLPDPASRVAGELRLRQATGAAAPPVAVVLPVAWGQALGLTEDPDALSPLVYLMGELINRGVEWGILTNGLRWRVYHVSYADADVGSAAAEPCEFDLAHFLGTGEDKELGRSRQAQVRLWWRLFGADAYVPDASGVSRMSALKAASAAYAQRVTSVLRRRLLSQILPELCGGFVADRYERLGIREETAEDRRAIVAAALGLVQRILFVLHAEARWSLPMGEPSYRGRSLTSLAGWAVGRLDRDLPLSTAVGATPRYGQLLTLFRDLEHGQPEMGLPAYGGSFFSPLIPEMSFLERHRLSDRAIARALAALSDLDGERIDYAALTPRHLSTVADGLIENPIWIVEPSAGQVALVNARRELETPAGVPTPDYVGLMVIERALRALLERRAQSFAAAMDRVVALRRADPVVLGAMGEVGGQAALLAAERMATEALLGIRVLDPAMGTGSFLVCSVDVLVDGIMAALAAYHAAHPNVPTEWNPVYRRLRAVRQTLLEGWAAQGVRMIPECVDDAAVLARVVAENAIYGVDLSAVAVSVSRLNLAMRCFVPGAPLPVFDRHLVRGNSLLGGHLADLTLGEEDADGDGGEAHPDIATAYAAVAGISRNATFAQRLEPFETLLDLWVSSQAGHAGARALLEARGSAVLAALRGEVPLTDDEAAVVEQVRALAHEQGYLHWDLAFPEVFTGTDRCDGYKGFDAVVGSPPAAELPVVTSYSVASVPDTSAFAALARRLVCTPHGRVAFVLTPQIGGFSQSRSRDTKVDGVAPGRAGSGSTAPSVDQITPGSRAVEQSDE